MHTYPVSQLVRLEFSIGVVFCFDGQSNSRIYRNCGARFRSGRNHIADEYFVDRHIVSPFFIFSGLRKDTTGGD
jgi:hypothetical protein